jgi:hypothetical protein
MTFSSGLAHKKAMNDLAILVTADAFGAMAIARNTDPRKFAGTLREVTPALIDNYSRVAGVLSTQYFLSERQAAGIQTQFTPRVELPNIQAATDSAVGYTTSRLVVEGDFATATTIFSGMVSKTVLSVDRDSLLVNIELDRAKYRRVASPTACTFCLYAAVNSFSTFSEDVHRYHDHCRCTVVPEWDDVVNDRPGYYDQFADLQSEAEANIARRRQELRPIWEAEWKANGGRMGKNLTRDFLRAYPDLSYTRRNILTEVARIQAGN